MRMSTSEGLQNSSSLKARVVMAGGEGTDDQNAALRTQENTALNTAGTHPQHLEGLLRAVATTQKLKLDRNGVEAAGPRVRALRNCPHSQWV